VAKHFLKEEPLPPIPSLFKLKDESPDFNTESVRVINGPDSLGDQVGVRIIEGLFSILKKIAEGRTNITI
ncbi:MAG: hypothetical protein PSV35_07360, partial [bacterium]|nr:hypothetical protein [bacterium]